VAATITSKLPDLTRMVVFLRGNGRCAYCGRKVAFRRGHAEHLTPRAWQGSDAVSNLAWSCRACNRMKGTADLECFAVMVFRYNYLPIKSRFTSEADMVAKVREITARKVTRAEAMAVLAEEK
jgi:5-methylcytosine-specific restriction endonuclease McrA